MPAAQPLLDLPVPVKESSHWRVTIRPEIFNAQRIPTLPDCWKIIESCAVSLRGWDYPHVDRTGRANGTDWISSWCDFRGHREYWRFFQSGQFVHLFSFREDAIPNALATAVGKIRPEIPTLGLQPSGCIDITELLYNVTEIYEFSSRLAQKTAIAGSLSIAIELVNVKSRILTALAPSRAWWGYHPTVEADLAHSREIAVEQLMGWSAELALEAAIWFFHRFQWNDPNLPTLQNDQRKLLTRSL